MRLWTLHPKYLDTKGLLAVWRESLLAQKVLQGKTKGYRHHPQLTRFKEQSDPASAISGYLSGIREEAQRRGYHFDGSKIAVHGVSVKIGCTRGQLLYEWEHLRKKLQGRDPRKYAEIGKVRRPEAHPIFLIVDGEIEPWEVK